MLIKCKKIDKNIFRNHTADIDNKLPDSKKEIAKSPLSSYSLLVSNSTRATSALLFVDFEDLQLGSFNED